MTKEQRELVRNHMYATVNYDSGMQEKIGTVGYCTKGKVHYEIHIDSSLKSNKKVLSSILIHEVGHLECEHLEIVHSEAEKLIKEAFERYESTNNIPKEDRKSNLKGFKGLVHKILNIAMDLEVNSKFLTFENIKDLANIGIEPITLKNLKASYKESWDLYIDDVVREMYDKIEVVSILGDIPEEDGSEGLPGGSGKSSSSSKGSEKKDVKSLGDALKEAGNDTDESEGETSGKDGQKDEADDSNKRVGSSSSANVIITHSSAEALSEMTKLLVSLRTVRRAKQLDSMRLYNRGTRRNPSGVLYSSVRKKVKKDSEKIGILIDVSGSMDTANIRKAMKSMANVAPAMNHQTLVKTWNAYKCEEFTIGELPENIRTGGGTDLCSGIKEFLDEGFKTIVIYSDFEDYLEKYLDVLDGNPCKLHLLCVESQDRAYDRGGWKELVSRACNVIYME